MRPHHSGASQSQPSHPSHEFSGFNAFNGFNGFNAGYWMPSENEENDMEWDKENMSYADQLHYQQQKYLEFEQMQQRQELLQSQQSQQSQQNKRIQRLTVDNSTRINAIDAFDTVNTINDRNNGSHRQVTTNVQERRPHGATATRVPPPRAPRTQHDPYSSEASHDRRYTSKTNKSHTKYNSKGFKSKSPKNEDSKSRKSKTRKSQSRKSQSRKSKSKSKIKTNKDRPEKQQKQQKQEKQEKQEQTNILTNNLSVINSINSARDQNKININFEEKLRKSLSLKEEISSLEEKVLKLEMEAEKKDNERANAFKKLECLGYDPIKMQPRDTQIAQSSQKSNKNNNDSRLIHLLSTDFSFIKKQLNEAKNKILDGQKQKKQIIEKVKKTNKKLDIDIVNLERVLQRMQANEIQDHEINNVIQNMGNVLWID